MKLARLAVLLMAVSGSLAAEDVKLVGTITKIVKSNSSSPVTMKTTRRAVVIPKPQIKKITLLKVKLSERARQKLVHKVQNALADTKQLVPSAEEPIAANYPMQIQLGMNNVPVLNQGVHGTCTMFACTAAIDAALNKGDYISQLCQLQLGSYLEKSGYAISGWEGAFGRTVMSQIEIFGIVSKEQQAAHSCAGMLEYPLYENAPAESTMNVEDFHQISERLDEKNIVWSPILDVYQAFTDRTDSRKTLNDVKASLRAGDRLVLGVLLVDLDIGTIGAVGTHKAAQDSWVLTPEIALDILLNPSFAGHQMVITGYDDNAVAVDNRGHEHHGLLTLRNSWGDKIGDQGDFYMSYDYFKLLVAEVLRIRSASL